MIPTVGPKARIFCARSSRRNRMAPKNSRSSRNSLPSIDCAFSANSAAAAPQSIVCHPPLVRNSLTMPYATAMRVRSRGHGDIVAKSEPRRPRGTRSRGSAYVAARARTLRSRRHIHRGSERSLPSIPRAFPRRSTIGANVRHWTHPGANHDQASHLSLCVVATPFLRHVPLALGFVGNFAGPRTPMATNRGSARIVVNLGLLACSHPE